MSLGTYLLEVLSHSVLTAIYIDVLLLLSGDVREVRLRDLLWIGGNVRGGHSGVDGGDATRIPRRADLVS